MSDTRARINKLRQIRRQMEKEIRMVEVEAARREKRRSQQKEERERLNRAKKHKQEDVSLVNNRVLINKTDQECKFFILTRNLILAASNRQLKSAFLLWRRKAGLERPKKTRRFVSNIPTRRRVTKRDETSSSEDTSLSDTETRESRYSPSPIHTSILKSSNPRAVWKNLLETPDERKVTITVQKEVASKPATPVSFSHDGAVMVTPGGTSSSDPEFTFTPQPGTPVVRQVLDTPVGVRVSDALNRSRHDTSISGDLSGKGSKKVAINIDKRVSATRDSGSSDVDEFLELESRAEQKTSSQSEPEEEVPEPQMSPIPAPYPDEMIEDEDSFVVSAIAATPKQVSYIENNSDDEISDGYIEESFSRQTSPKSVVKKNFSGSLRDKLDNDTKACSLPSPKEKRKRKESVVRDLSGFEELSGISSGSPQKQALASSSGLATPKYTFRATQGNEDGLSTPARKAKLAEILEYVESLGNEQEIPTSSFSDLSKSLPSPSMKELSLDIGDIAVERTTPYTLRQGRSPPRLLQSDSPKSSPTPDYDDTIVQEIPSPYIVKRGEYLCQLVNESPKETLYLNDDGMASEEPTEYSITKRSTPPRSFISESPRRPQTTSSDTSQLDETGVSRYIDDSSGASTDETQSTTPPNEPSRRSDSENDSALRPEIQKYLKSSNEMQDLLSDDQSTMLTTDHPRRYTASEEDYDDELDMKSYNNLMNLDLSSSGSDC